MTRKATPLLAVVMGLSVAAPAAASNDTDPYKPRTLPSGAPACGNTQSKKPRPCPKPEAERPAATSVVLPVAAIPRTLPSGAPACGNVLEKVNGDHKDPTYLSCLKGEWPGVELQRKMTQERILIQSRAAVQKLLRYVGIASPPTEIRDPEASPAQRARTVPAQRIVVPQEVQPIAPAEPRRMRNGAPANGNVPSRALPKER